MGRDRDVTRDTTGVVTTTGAFEATNMGGTSRRATGITYAAVSAGYLVLAVVLWWGAWSTHPTSVATCACNDPSLFVWFLEWPAYAIAHAHNPFYSSSIFYPKGINLLSNTGVLALGLPLAPVTWLFGPVATLNVASTLGPALTALSMFWLLRRWVRWTPAAFAGGLLFGFSPFAVVNLAVAHLNTEVLALVPLIVGCLDELLIRRTHRPGRVGAALGLLVVAQFFLSSEMLVIVGVCGLAGVVILGAYCVSRRLFHPKAHTRGVPISEDARGAAVRHVTTGAVVAAGVTGVLLAYPVWFALDGPAHLSGLVWPTITPGTGGIDLRNVWSLHFMSAEAVRLFAGYQGPALPQGEYMGVSLIVVLGAGLVAFFRERLLCLFALLGALTAWLSLGVTESYWVPWRVLAHVPLIQNVTVARIFAMTTFCASVMLGVVVDRAYARIVRAGVRARLPRNLCRAVATMVSLAVAVVALVPAATAISSNFPFTTKGVDLPTWFADIGARLPAGQVVLTYPPPVAGGQGMTWQAINLLRYSVATGGGPGSISSRAGAERPGLDVLTQASLVLSPAPVASAVHVEAVRSALIGWRVTEVVVPDPASVQPTYDRAASTSWALGMFTLAIGREPKFVDDAWVWTGVRSLGPRRSVPIQTFTRCTTGSLLHSSDPEAVPECVVGSGRSSAGGSKAP